LWGKWELEFFAAGRKIIEQMIALLFRGLGLGFQKALPWEGFEESSLRGLWELNGS
jgi:hypothetical protein